jgi:hypothetical protein
MKVAMGKRQVTFIQREIKIVREMKTKAVKMNAGLIKRARAYTGIHKSLQSSGFGWLRLKSQFIKLGSLSEATPFKKAVALLTQSHGIRRYILLGWRGGGFHKQAGQGTDCR